MKTCRLRLDLEYDEKKTDPEALANAYDRLLGTAITTPGILDEYGEVDTGEFFVDLDPPTTFEAVALLREGGTKCPGRYMDMDNVRQAIRVRRVALGN